MAKPKNPRKASRRASTPRIPRNLLESLALKLAQEPLGNRIIILPFLPTCIYPASFVLYGKAAGYLGLVLAALCFLYAVFQTERFINQVTDGHNANSISALLVKHLLLATCALVVAITIEQLLKIGTV
ncbi:hypothetical protein ACFSB1_13860 [Halopseudomonas phragmitis]|uniref:Uncharacterized protein n=2 Tax=Pseudomonadaceae TaxID=135621 RepID=A0A1V0B4S6_9GAMM|nr:MULTISPECIES: hypothetical protein [Pseudomonadaceae]AQZ94942.1 hypothetical protein BVH74_09360 [Halopseudomonas phragmitis]RHW23100.1 hypothetical protein C2846_01480 [Pseudomonas jilinensis]